MQKQKTKAKMLYPPRKDDPITVTLKTELKLASSLTPKGPA